MNPTRFTRLGGTILVSLEARTGRKVEFQDEEARKAGKG